MGLQIKKTFKQDNIKLSLFRVLRPPTKSGYIMFGKTASGKTVLMVNISARMHDKYAFKIWDIWGGRRNQGENLYWCLPSPYKKYWKFIQKKFKFDDYGSKQYKVNLAYPLTIDIPESLPFLKNEKDEAIINPFPFTIPISEIDVTLIKFALNNLSDSDVTLWEDIKNNLKKSDGMPELTRLFEKKGENTNVYKNFFKPLIDMRLLSSDIDENSFNLDKLTKEAKNREPIFVLVLHHIPEKFRLFIMGWLIQKLWDAMDIGKISGKNIINIREVTEFFRATEKSAVDTRFKNFKIFLSDKIRQARGRIGFILDAQSVSETSGVIQGTFDFQILGKMPGQNDREEATQQLKRDGHITDKQVTDLGELEPGEYYFVEDGKNAKKIYSFLPPCDFFRSSDQNFYHIWEKRVGSDKFIDLKDKITHIDDQYKIKMKEIRDEERQKALARKEQDELKEKLEADRQMKEKIERDAQYHLELSKKKLENKSKLKDKKINKEEEPIKIVEKKEEEDRLESLDEDSNSNINEDNEDEDILGDLW